MGTKIITFITFVSFFNTCFSQISDAPATRKKEKIELLKEYALCDCLFINYKAVDSTFRSRDASKSFIFQIKAIDYHLLDKIEWYTRKETSNYYKREIIENLDFHANYIFLYCVEFYKSKELKKYIQHILKE